MLFNSYHYDLNLIYLTRLFNVILLQEDNNADIDLAEIVASGMTYYISAFFRGSKAFV